MAAEMQPQFICGQPTHSVAWEGMKSRQGPPTAPHSERALQGVGLGGIGPFRGRQHSLKNLV